MHGRRSRLAGLGVALTLVVSGLAIGTAQAGTGQSPDAAYYQSVVAGITPDVPGLKITVAGAGDSITVVNDTGKTVVVLGYTGEPYLQIGPGGVDENVGSLTHSLNSSATPQASQLTQAAASQRVVWQHLGAQKSYTWHDYRVQWNVKQRPPIVTSDPHHAHRVFEWALQLTVDGSPALVRGWVQWTGEPVFSTGQIAELVLGVLVLLGGTVFLVLRMRGKGNRRGGSRRGGRYARTGDDREVDLSRPTEFAGTVSKSSPLFRATSSDRWDD